MVCVLNIFLYLLDSIFAGNSHQLPEKEYIGKIQDHSENCRKTTASRLWKELPGQKQQESTGSLPGREESGPTNFSFYVALPRIQTPHEGCCIAPASGHTQPGLGKVGILVGSLNKLIAHGGSGGFLKQSQGIATIRERNASCVSYCNGCPLQQLFES